MTEANLEYEDSITIDRYLMNAAGLLPFEKVEVYNVTTGTRFETYVVEGIAGVGDIRIDGAAAHLAKRGDKVIIACYCALHEGQMLEHKPKLVSVDERNQIKVLRETGLAQTIAV